MVIPRAAGEPITGSHRTNEELQRTCLISAFSYNILNMELYVTYIDLNDCSSTNSALKLVISFAYIIALYRVLSGEKLVKRSQK